MLDLNLICQSADGVHNESLNFSILIPLNSFPLSFYKLISPPT